MINYWQIVGPHRGPEGHRRRDHYSFLWRRFGAVRSDWRLILYEYRDQTSGDMVYSVYAEMIKDPDRTDYMKRYVADLQEWSGWMI